MHSLKKMSAAVLLSLGLATLLLQAACKKNDNDQESFKHYPAGISQIGETGKTDCTLDRCNADRKIILKADNVEGTVVNSIDAATQEEKYYIHVAFPGAIDGYLNGDCCNFTDQLKLLDGQKVRFSGEYRDGCGQLFQTVGGEEIYFLKLSQLKEL